MAEVDEAELGSIPERGAPLIASWQRWAVLTVLAFCASYYVPFAYESMAHREIKHFSGIVSTLTIVLALLAWSSLRSEEARLTRELRIARSGTATMRSLALRRHQAARFLGRLVSCTYGQAALFLAEGDRNAAVLALNANALFLKGGRLEWLRRAVEADIDRAMATAAGLEHAIASLWNQPPCGNREADRYRTHVLVKAILEKGSGDRAEELSAQLRTNPDEEQRVYATWLDTWFEIESPTPPSEAEIRLALLLARAQGAEALVTKLEEKLSQSPVNSEAPN